MDALRLLDAQALSPTTFVLREPSLDDVFLALTGKRTDTGDDDPDAAPADGGGRRGRRQAAAHSSAGGAQ